MGRQVEIAGIDGRIYVFRGLNVMLDEDLAALYGVETKRLNEQVKRNMARFPSDFMFQLSKDELDILKSQFATSSWGGRRTPPYAFTRDGIAMLSSVLNSERAIQVNIQIMRTFTKIREIMHSNESLRTKINSLEKKYDSQFGEVFEVLRRLLDSPKPKGKKIGFD